jgi:sugar transferase EpsL
MPWPDKLAMDVWYVDHRSLVLDVRILLKTLWVMVTRRGVTLAGHATTVRFRGDDQAPRSDARDDRQEPGAS